MEDWHASWCRLCGLMSKNNRWGCLDRRHALVWVILNSPPKYLTKGDVRRTVMHGFVKTEVTSQHVAHFAFHSTITISEFITVSYYRHSSYNDLWKKENRGVLWIINTQNSLFPYFWTRKTFFFQLKYHYINEKYRLDCINVASHNWHVLFKEAKDGVSSG